MYAQQQYFNQKPSDVGNDGQDAPTSPQFPPPGQQYHPVPVPHHMPQDMSHSSAFSMPHEFPLPNEGNHLHESYANSQDAIIHKSDLHQSIDEEVKGDEAVDLIPPNFFADTYSPANDLKRSSDSEDGEGNGLKRARLSEHPELLKGME